MKKPDLRLINILILSGLWIAFIPFSGLSEEKSAQSYWASSPVQIDGSFADWFDVPFTEEKKMELEFAFKNNEENLYILFLFKNPKYLSSIGVTGMTLWLDGKQESKTRPKIVFIQKQLSSEELISLLEKKNGPLPEEKKKQLQGSPSYLINDAEVALGKDKVFSQLLEKPEEKTASFSFNKFHNYFVFEFAVNLRKVSTEVPEMAVSPGENLEMGFEWGGMTNEMKKEMMRREGLLNKTVTSEEEFSESRSDMASTVSIPLGTSPGPKKYDLRVSVKLAGKQLL